MIIIIIIIMIIIKCNSTANLLNDLTFLCLYPKDAATATDNLSDTIDGELSDSEDDLPDDRIADDDIEYFRSTRLTSSYNAMLDAAGARHAIGEEVAKTDASLPPLHVLPLFANLPASQQARVGG